MDLVSPSSGLIYWQLGGLLASIIYFGFLIYALIDLIKSDFRDNNMKLIWIILILFAQPIGTFLYLGLRRRSKADYKKFNPNFNTYKQ